MNGGNPSCLGFIRAPKSRVLRGARRTTLAAVAAAVLAVALLAAAPWAEAAPDDNGLFELDANVLTRPPRATTGPTSSPAPTRAFVDTGIVADPAPQSIFTGGGSKDDLDIPQWKHKNGSVPDKDDITNAYAAAYTLGGDTFIYFGLDRFAVQGSANVGFWFLQDDVAPIPGTPAGRPAVHRPAPGGRPAGAQRVQRRRHRASRSRSSSGSAPAATRVAAPWRPWSVGDNGLPADCDVTGSARERVRQREHRTHPGRGHPVELRGQGRHPRHADRHRSSRAASTSAPCCPRSPASRTWSPRPGRRSRSTRS